jgi:hypothetical protein
MAQDMAAQAPHSLAITMPQMMLHCNMFRGGEFPATIPLAEFLDVVRPLQPCSVAPTSALYVTEISTSV